MGDQEQQKPVVIQQGSNGVGLVLAALILGGGNRLCREHLVKHTTAETESSR